MPKEASSPHDGDISYDNSPKIEAKRSHQWFMDGPEADLFPSKKQAIEGLNNNNSFLGMLTSSSSPWSTDAGVQTLSGHFDDQLFAAEASRTVNYEERSIPSMVSENFSLGRKVHENPFNDSSFALSMSCASEDIRSSLNYGGVRKVKVSEVKDRVPIVPPVTSGQTYNMMESSAIFTSPALGKADETPMSLSCPSTLGEENNIHPGTNDGRVDNFIMSMAQPNDTEDKNTSMGHSYDNGIWKDESSIIGISQSYRADDCSISMNHMYSRGNSDSVTMSNSYNMGCGNIGHSFGKGQSTIISFGGYDEDTNASGGLAYNYELLMAQHAAQTSNGMSEIDLVNPNSDAYENVSSQINLSGIDITSKKKEEPNGSKKASSNSFPSNVRSLLSTGVLDGILVKYIAWSKEVNLSLFLCLFFNQMAISS